MQAGFLYTFFFNILLCIRYTIFHRNWLISHSPTTRKRVSGICKMPTVCHKPTPDRVSNSPIQAETDDLWSAECNHSTGRTRPTTSSTSSGNTPRTASPTNEDKTQFVKLRVRSPPSEESLNLPWNSTLSGRHNKCPTSRGAVHRRCIDTQTHTDTPTHMLLSDTRFE